MPLFGPYSQPGSSNTGTSAPVISSPGFAVGTASQLSDLSRDYMVYLQIGTPGTGCTVEIGHTSAASDAIVFNNATPTAEESITVRLPAGWYLKVTGSATTIASQVAVGC